MTPWVLRLIVLNVVVFVAQQLYPPLTQMLWFVPAFILVRPWTTITYLFVHGGWLHILFNMLALFWFGPRVEERLGGRSFLTLYFISGIAGALLSFAIPATRMVPIVGASGAIMGVMVAFARYWPRVRFYLYGVVPVEAWLLILLYVISGSQRCVRDRWRRGCPLRAPWGRGRRVSLSDRPRVAIAGATMAASGRAHGAAARVRRRRSTTAMA